MKRKILEKIVALVCSFVMILAMAFTFVSAPASAGSILHLTGAERDPVLTDSQLEEVCENVASTYSLNADRQVAQIVEENNEKQEILDKASADMLRLQGEIQAAVDDFNAYDMVWNEMFNGIHDHPRYVEAYATGDDELILTVALELIGKTREEYEAYRAELAVRYARIEALTQEFDQARLTIAIYAPAPAE